MAGHGGHPCPASRTRVGVDGTSREYLVSVPPGPVTGVVVAFHPWGFDPEAVLYGEEPGERLVRRLPGLLGPARAMGLALVAPRGVGRVLAGVSLAWAAHVDSAADVALDVARELSAGTGRIPVTAVGLSQGGLEALVCAGRHPDEIGAVVAVNPLVDLVALYHDVDRIPVAHMKDRGALDDMRREIGGTPDEVPERYADRSPMHYLTELSRVPVGLVWTPDDGVVALPDAHHSGRLAAELRRAGAVLVERRTTEVGPDPTLGWRYSHESFDPWSGLGLLHDLLQNGQSE